MDNLPSKHHHAYEHRINSNTKDKTNSTAARRRKKKHNRPFPQTRERKREKKEKYDKPIKIPTSLTSIILNEARINTYARQYRVTGIDPHKKKVRERDTHTHARVSERGSHNRNDQFGPINSEKTPNSIS